MLKKLVGMLHLRSLAYSDGEDLAVIAVAFPNLEKINCKDAIDAEKLAKVGKNLTQLTVLTTSVKPSEGLLKSLASLPTLKSLQVERSLSVEEIAAIRSKLPNASVRSVTSVTK